MNFAIMEELGAGVIPAEELGAVVIPAEELGAGVIPAAEVAEVTEGDVPAVIREEEEKQEKLQTSEQELKSDKLSAVEIPHERTLEEILEVLSASSRARVDGSDSFTALKYKLIAMTYPDMSIGSSALLCFLNPRCVHGLGEFREYLEACTAVFSHCNLDAAKFVQLHGPDVSPLEFSG